MAAEIIRVVDTVSEAKDVEREVLFEAIENAIASATKKKHQENMDVRVIIDRDTGDYKTFRQWMVFEDDSRELEDPDIELRMIDAVDIQKDASPGEYVLQEIESVDFGRIGAQIAKQVIVQKVREAEKQKTIDQFKDNIGDLVSGIVKRVDRNGFYIDIGNNSEAFLPRREMIPKEAMRPQDRIKALLKDINTDLKGPPLILSRVMPEFLIELFKVEVPEITQNLIEIVGASRDPGLRAKIAVRSDDKRIDAVGACVGMRGSRVQSVSNELNGERIDIILWSDNDAQYVVNAMSPANVVSIVVDEENQSMDIAVAEEQLSQAIGRGGQNVRLASELTGWDLNVMSKDDADSKIMEENQNLSAIFKEELNVDQDVADVLAREGFSSIDEVAYCSLDEFKSIEDFDEDLISELRKRAAEIIESKKDKEEQENSLSNIKELSKSNIEKLKNNDVNNKEDLADLSVDELLEMIDLDKEDAGKIIMEAREPWFNQE